MLKGWELEESSESLCNDTGDNILEQERNTEHTEHLNDLKGAVKRVSSVSEIFINFITGNKH